MRLRIRTAAVAATAATALLLTACGGSDNGDDGISGIGGGETPVEDEPEDEEPTEEADDVEPEIELPDDITHVFDWETPEDPDDAAAVRNATQFLRAITKGIVEQDPEHSAYKGYSLEDAREYGHTQISAWVDGGWVRTGSDRFYDLAIDRRSEDTVRLEFCRDNSEMYGKEVDTGELVPKEEGGAHASYSHYSIMMWDSPGGERAYVARAVVVEGEASQCAG